jgi:hypothetical protein
MEKRPKVNFYSSSNFDAVIFFELIVTRASGSAPVDFLYQLWFSG